MSRLFGTDGVRGVANCELTPELALQIGRAAASVLSERGDGDAPIVVGRDTRVSGTMLEAALIAGITSVGRNAISIGIVPTPAVACVVRSIGGAAGAMISASHNPIADNGIKFSARTALSSRIRWKIASKRCSILPSCPVLAASRSAPRR